MAKNEQKKVPDDEWTKILLDAARDKLEKPSIIAAIIMIIVMVVLIDLIARYIS